MTYRMDAATRKHLLAWCEREYWRDPEARANAIQEWLEDMDADEAAYYLDKGWRTVDDALGDDEESPEEESDIEYDDDEEEDK